MKIHKKNTTKYEIFFAGLPPRTRPGAAAPDPAWGYRPRPLVLRPPPYRAPPSPPQRPSTSRGMCQIHGSTESGMCHGMWGAGVQSSSACT